MKFSDDCHPTVIRVCILHIPRLLRAFSLRVSVHDDDNLTYLWLFLFHFPILSSLFCNCCLHNITLGYAIFSVDMIILSCSVFIFIIAIFITVLSYIYYWNQANHRITTTMQRRIYSHATDVEIRPLNEEKAVQAAVDLIGEFFVFSVIFLFNIHI